MAGAAVQNAVAGETRRPGFMHNEVLLSNQQAVTVLAEIMNQNI